MSLAHDMAVRKKCVCGRCTSERMEELNRTVREIVSLVDVDQNFAVILDAHKFVETIKRLRALTE